MKFLIAAIVLMSFSAMGFTPIELPGDIKCQVQVSQLNKKLSSMEAKINLLLQQSCPQRPGNSSPINGGVPYTQQNYTSGEPLRLFDVQQRKLYYETANKVTLNFPQLERVSANYQLNVAATNADINQDVSDQHKLTVVPDGGRVDLSVDAIVDDGSGQTQQYGMNILSYSVNRPPRPEIKVLVNGRQHNGATLISKRSRVVIKVEPDADFKLEYPQDARYRITRVTLLAQRSLGAPTTIGVYRGNGSTVSISLGNRLKADSPGTKIYLKIEDIYRINFENKRILLPISERERMIGMVIR